MMERWKIVLDKGISKRTILCDFLRLRENNPKRQKDFQVFYY